MEEEKAKEASETKHKIVKKPNWNKIGIFIGAVVIIVILLLFIFGIFKFPTNLTSKVTQQTVELEMLDLDYGIELEDETLLDSGTNNFVIGTINSEDCRNHVIKNFSIENEARNYLSLYKRLMPLPGFEPGSQG